MCEARKNIRYLHISSIFYNSKYNFLIETHNVYLEVKEQRAHILKVMATAFVTVLKTTKA